MTHVATDSQNSVIQKLNSHYCNELIQMQHFSGDKDSRCDMGYDTTSQSLYQCCGEIYCLTRQAAVSSKMLVTTYQTTKQCHNAEDQNMYDEFVQHKTVFSSLKTEDQLLNQI